MSPKIVSRLAELFPGSTHVFNTALARFTSDQKIHDYAGENGFAVITADADFLDLLAQRGGPPKIIRLEKCDYKTATVEQLLRRNAIRIAELESSDRDHLIIRNTR